MASNSYNKFEKRLALVAYYRRLFGVSDIHDSQAVKRYHEELNELREGYDAEGRSYLYSALVGRVRDIDTTDLLRYDQNVRRHTQALNRLRHEPITLKYFQVLAALKTEHYLDHVTANPDAFLRSINAFVETQNEESAGRITFPSFGLDDLNKIAYWMATGSGKTLLLHLNYYQYLHYRKQAGAPLDHILLVTPNEGLSEQHIAEMERSGIPCYRFTEATGGLFEGQPVAVKVIEITKLVEEKTGGGVSVEVSAFEGRNLVFVDEGHKGSGAEVWRSMRATLAERGFTFEYSATFGQAVSSSSTSAEVEEEYGRAILVDYAYPRFYGDGYGKDYRILNLNNDFPESDLTQRYLLANLLTFYEQLRAYESSEETFFGEYNLMPPLMLFIGHSVAAGKTSSQLGAQDKRTLSDVQELVRFLHTVLTGSAWVPNAINAILGGSAGLLRESGDDLFKEAFPVLRSDGRGGQAIYADLLRRIFHVTGPTSLHLANLKTSQGEIGLRAGATDTFFGVINIGDDSNFLSAVEKHLPDIVVEASEQESSLFKSINKQDSSVQILVGAKKFIEGWSSWRVSTMGLMNIGRGEGPQIIQLFGRGVRLKGKNSSLKRSSALPHSGPHPDHLALLETLNIFGVRAKYMAQFRDYLEDEGIDADERETLYIETQVQEDFLNKGLLTIRPRIAQPFEEAMRLQLVSKEEAAPKIDLTPQMDALVSEEHVSEGPVASESLPEQSIPERFLPLLNWDNLYREVWHYRVQKGYTNLLIDQATLREIIKGQHYHLTCPPELLEVKRYADIERVEALALMILRAYGTQFFSQAKRHWEQAQLDYTLLDDTDDNIIQTIEVRVQRSATDFLDDLHALLEDSDLYEKEDNRLPRVYFDRHLYLPLLKEDETQTALFAPPGLNQGEWQFVRDLRDFLKTDDGLCFMEGKELYLLRNQSRGHGVGFMAGEGMYFPDFILWIQTSTHQHITFIDPKGLMVGSSPTNPKVQLHRDIKTYEQRLNEKSKRSNVCLHAFMVSQTGYQDLKNSWGLISYSDFNSLHVFFPTQDQYINLLLAQVLSDPGSTAPNIDVP